MGELIDSTGGPLTSERRRRPISVALVALASMVGNGRSSQFSGALGSAVAITANIAAANSGNSPLNKLNLTLRRAYK